MFKDLFKKRSANSPEASSETDPMQLAVAALLVEAARADEQYAESEIAIIDKSLATTFGLSTSEAATLRSEAERVQENAIDIHRFTKVAKTMAQAEKVALIEQLWEIVLSDGDRDPHEDALIRRICGLIYLSDPESGAARARAQTRLKAG